MLSMGARRCSTRRRAVRLLGQGHHVHGDHQRGALGHQRVAHVVEDLAAHRGHDHVPGLVRRPAYVAVVHHLDVPEPAAEGDQHARPPARTAPPGGGATTRSPVTSCPPSPLPRNRRIRSAGLPRPIPSRGPSSPAERTAGHGRPPGPAPKAFACRTNGRGRAVPRRGRRAAERPAGADGAGAAALAEPRHGTGAGRWPERGRPGRRRRPSGAEVHLGAAFEPATAAQRPRCGRQEGRPAHQRGLA